MSQSDRITVWNMGDDVEWWIGAGPATAIAAAYQEAYGEDAECDPEELTEEALDTLKYSDCDENERPTGVVRTFREQLAIEIAEGGEFPRLFAASGW